MKKLVLLVAVLSAFSAPSYAGVSVLGESFRLSTLAPGSREDGVILVQNGDAFPVRVAVGVNDYLFRFDAGDETAPPSSTLRSNALWLSFSPSQIRIPPYGIGKLLYRIEVPQSAQLKGNYWSQVTLRAAPASEGSAYAESAASTATVLIVADLGEGERLIRLTGRETKARGKKGFQLELENCGELWLYPSVKVDLYDQSGESVGHFEAEERRVCPGCSVRRSIDLSEVPAGRYTLFAIVDDRSGELFGSQYQLDIP